MIDAEILQGLKQYVMKGRTTEPQTVGEFRIKQEDEFKPYYINQGPKRGAGLIREEDLQPYSRYAAL